MTNVADIELCKELYKLSGWGERHHMLWWIDDSVWDTAMQSDYTNGRENWQAPAYDCGYLLRRLPKAGDNNGLRRIDIYGTVKWSNKWNKWITQFGRSYVSREVGDQHKLYTYKADTPEDALAKLCIGLIKQGYRYE